MYSSRPPSSSKPLFLDLFMNASFSERHISFTGYVPVLFRSVLKSLIVNPGSMLLMASNLQARKSSVWPSRSHGAWKPIWLNCPTRLHLPIIFTLQYYAKSFKVSTLQIQWVLSSVGALKKYFKTWNHKIPTSHQIVCWQATMQILQHICGTTVNTGK